MAENATTTSGGDLLRDWLRVQRRSQEWLAEQIGAHQTYVSRWILGRTPPLEMALAIERVTGIDPSHWICPAGESSDSLEESSKAGAR